ncbi:hypothetical protein [Burkholderia stagnalis]|uniref:hypothetical protein n=1 Tax=Burkholderia stagnalis TaxID=1503054 RepID=UPI000AF8C1FE|nr:hypothetical protein [Burkholderia stagnalis]
MAFIQYNQNIRLGNNYKDVNKGGYLGVGSASTFGSGAKNTVGTYSNFQNNDIPTRWVIQMVATTGDGTYVRSGDRVKIKSVSDSNNSNNINYYLALFNNSLEGNAGYTVATAQDASISNNTVTTTWSIIVNPKINTTNDSRVDDVSPVFLMATFNQENKTNGQVTGPYASILDTNGYALASSGFYILVTGARLLNRDNGSGSWQVVGV